MHPTVRAAFVRGLAIPAHPLALTDEGRFDERRQRALTRYYVAAVFARREDVSETLRHLALPLSRLPEFTRWRLPRDPDPQR